ncbi:MAG: nucleotide sugar dehydrogenase [Chlorobiota bacterium]|jgi:UDP-N-acetyl-D-glucosamine dehydrogenase|nr:nucleotide sugar dehydrogenase [Chlorobiota bacterium]QQS67179.1 MAG: nucleotide sugar dehydrogenase [Chlorobiota bacterium]
MSLLEKIKNKEFTVGVVGLGYVGLPLAVEFAKNGIDVWGIDVDSRKIDSLKLGVNYIQDLNNEEVNQVLKSKKLQASTDFSVCSNCDVIYVCVPTPFTPNKEPDISYILQAAEGISQNRKKEQCIILKSTTFPNTTEGYVLPILQYDDWKIGENFYLAFSPERIDPGNKNWHTSNTPIVVGGVTAVCTKIAAEANRIIIDKVIEVSSPKVAEMEKLLENIFRSVNIALVNELAQLCDRMGGVNMWEVVDAAASKPFGFMPFYPGPGIGGHCILIDPYYLSWLAREHDFVTNFITLAAEVNESMPFYVKQMVLHQIAHLPVTLKTAKIVILGVAFKRDVDDLRHSPAHRVMELLKQDGACNMVYVDSFIPQMDLLGQKLNSEKYSIELLQSADLVVITTDHTDIDYSEVVNYSNVVIDTRNATKNVKLGREKIVLLGDGK